MIDGVQAAGEWDGPVINVGAAKLNAGAVLAGDSLYVWAKQPIELRTKDGQRVEPAAQCTGEVFEARFTRKAIGWTDAAGEVQLWLAPAVSLLLSPEGDRIKLR